MSSSACAPSAGQTAAEYMGVLLLVAATIIASSRSPASASGSATTPGSWSARSRSGDNCEATAGNPDAPDAVQVRRLVLGQIDPGRGQGPRVQARGRRHRRLPRLRRRHDLRHAEGQRGRGAGVLDPRRRGRQRRRRRPPRPRASSASPAGRVRAHLEVRLHRRRRRLHRQRRQEGQRQARPDPELPPDDDDYDLPDQDSDTVYGGITSPARSPAAAAAPTRPPAAASRPASAPSTWTTAT